MAETPLHEYRIVKSKTGWEVFDNFEATKLVELHKKFSLFGLRYIITGEEDLGLLKSSFTRRKWKLIKEGQTVAIIAIRWALLGKGATVRIGEKRLVGKEYLHSKFQLVDDNTDGVKVRIDRSSLSQPTTFLIEDLSDLDPLIVCCAGIVIDRRYWPH